MRVCAALYHTFMPPLYAGTLYQGLYQVYATRAPLGFIPGLPVVSLLSPCGLPVAFLWSPCGQAWFGLAWLGFDWLGWVAIGSIGNIGSDLLGLYLGSSTLSDDFSSSRRLYGGLCRGIILHYAGAM